uniref:Uncharacterized protein n=1 Tax=Anguilla anguilla TaxID=7936 RepID=A0A0E9WFC3_ANGAN
MFIFLKSSLDHIAIQLQHKQTLQQTDQNLNTKEVLGDHHDAKWSLFTSVVLLYRIFL